jgi:hypothetical protein
MDTFSMSAQMTLLSPSDDPFVLDSVECQKCKAISFRRNVEPVQFDYRIGYLFIHMIVL